jgi:hypothetical protein
MTAPYQNLLERLTAPPKQLMDGVEEIPAMYKMAPVESAERYDGVRPQELGPHQSYSWGRSSTCSMRSRSREVGVNEKDVCSLNVH